MIQRDGQLTNGSRIYESKADSNLYFKVEGRRPVILLLYVDDLLLTEKRNSLKLQEGDLLPSSR